TRPVAGGSAPWGDGEPAALRGGGGSSAGGRPLPGRGQRAGAVRGLGLRGGGPRPARAARRPRRRGAAAAHLARLPFGDGGTGRGSLPRRRPAGPALAAADPLGLQSHRNVDLEGGGHGPRV